MNKEEIENRIIVCEMKANAYREVGNTKTADRYDNERYKWEKILSDLELLDERKIKELLDYKKGYFYLQQENQELKLELSGYRQAILEDKDMLGLKEENQELKKQHEEVEFIVGLRQKRNLIHKFDKEYDNEDKKKNPNRDYAGIMPDAEEVYRRYYSVKNQQKEFIEYMNKTIEELECDDVDDEEMKGYLIQRIDTFKEILSKYKKIIEVE